MNEFVSNRALAAIEALLAAARRAWRGFLQWRQVNATREILRRLDDQALRDLGLTRDEIASAAAEAAGAAERTRRRIRT